MNKPDFLTTQLSVFQKLEAWLGGVSIAFIVMGLISMVFFFHQNQDVYYQGIYIDGIHVGGLTQAEARQLVLQKTTADTTEQLTSSLITLVVDDISVSSSAAQLQIEKEYAGVLSEAFQVGRTGFPLTRIATVFRLRTNHQNFESDWKVSAENIEPLIASLAAQVDVEGKVPAATLTYSGNPESIVIEPGFIGRAVETSDLSKTLIELVSETEQLESLQLQAPVASTAAELTAEQSEAARERAQVFVGKKIIFSADELSEILNDQDLVSLLALPEGYNQKALTTLTDTWLTSINRPAQNPVLEYDPETLEVTNFSPPRYGLTLDQEETHSQIISTLSEIELAADATAENETPPESYSLSLPVETTEPEISLESLNDLGIKERIGLGTSEYDHSIPSRIHNVSHTSEIMNNKLIAPGQEFSFVKELGEVSQRTGFLPAYVIKGGRTVLGDGGGVCQVSTTLFRSVLDAGLEVTKRRQHSYRVSYYEQNNKPGIDATVYSGDVDFRFINDTGHYILVHSYADSENLEMQIELYGTSDGRQTEIVDHEVWGYSSPPPTVYIDDPSLPAGAIRRVENAIAGVKTKFTNVIKDEDGNVIREDEYYSNYVPWGAKYLRGI